MKEQHIYLGIGYPGEAKDIIVKLPIEQFNRREVKEVINDAIELIYDGEYEREGSEDEPDES